MELKRRNAKLGAYMDEEQEIALTGVIRELEEELAAALEKQRVRVSLTCESFILAQLRKLTGASEVDV